MFNSRQLGYGDTIALCKVCRKPLDKAPAKIDGEPTYIGYLTCPSHPHSEVVYENKTIKHAKSKYLCPNCKDQLEVIFVNGELYGFECSLCECAFPFDNIYCT